MNEFLRILSGNRKKIINFGEDSWAYPIFGYIHYTCFNNMNKLNPREIVVLKYLHGDYKHLQMATGTNLNVPAIFNGKEFVTACNSLVEKEMIQPSHGEGHILQDATILPKGQTYLDERTEQQEKNKKESATKQILRNVLSVGEGHRTYWRNGVYGIIIDFDSTGEFHLIDFIDEYTKNPLYLSKKDEKENSQILAKGLVGYLLNQYITGRLTDIEVAYRNYAEKCFKEFERGARLNPNMMNRNLRSLFFRYHHDNEEKRKIKKSEAIYPYLTELDVYWIEECINGYWAFIKEYKKTHCAPKPFTLDSFMSLFGKEGLASKCLLWMEEKHDIHPSFSKWTLTNVNTEQLSKDIIIGSDEINFDAFKTGKETLLDEIESILKRNDANERQREMVRILNAFGHFSSKLYPFTECRICVQQIHKHLAKNKNTDISALLQSEDHSVKYFKLLLDYRFKIDKYKEKYIYDWDIELYTKKYIELFYRFVRNLDYLLMQYGIDLLELQNGCGVHLMKPNKPGDIAFCCQWINYETISYFYNMLPNRKKNMEKEEKIMIFLEHPYLEEEETSAEEEETKEVNVQQKETGSSSNKDDIIDAIKELTQKVDQSHNDLKEAVLGVKNSTEQQGKQIVQNIKGVSKKIAPKKLIRSQESKQQKQETDSPKLTVKAEKFKKTVEPFGFEHLPKVKVLNPKQQAQLIESIVKNACYGAAMLHYLEYHEHLLETYKMTKEKIYRHCSEAIGYGYSTYKKYYCSITTINDQNETYLRHNSKAYIDRGDIESDYNKIVQSK